MFRTFHSTRTNVSVGALQVILLISRVIADFARGEIKQMTALFDTDVTMSDYIDKSFYKTASLIAASCRCAAHHIVAMALPHQHITHECS